MYGVDTRPAPRRGAPPTRLARLAVAALCALGLTAGCAARADRFAAHRDLPSASPPDLRRGELTGRGGYASLGARVRLRDDTPPLTPIVEAERAASMATLYFVEPGPEGAYGPSGCRSPEGGAFGPYDAFGAVGFVGPYLAPGGALYPGLRPPPRADAPSAFAAPFHASPDADVSRHRPGLSTGSGIYRRNGR